MCKKIVIFIISILFFFDGEAQKITVFSEDSLKFIKELDNFFQENSANKEEAKKYTDEFSDYWKSGVFSNYYKKYVYTTCNTMFSKKLKPYPYFHDYLIAVSNFIESHHPTIEFENWQSCIDKILSKKEAKSFADYLTMSLNLFESNVFYKTPSYYWGTLDGNYRFEYDSVPKLVFSKFTLVGTNSRGDSILVSDIEGVYYPVKGRFFGKGGVLRWERTGLSQEVFANLKKLNIDCKMGGYVSDSATFNHPAYFDKPQLGKVEDKIITENDIPTYPRFESYTKRLPVKNVLKDVDYEGGFSMRGPRFVGSGDTRNPAKIIFRRGGVPFLQLSSKNFAMSSDRITSNLAAVKFFLDKDSIVHPGLSFKYLADQRKVSLIRTDDGLQKSPFYSSFHKLDMYFEELVWKIDSAKIELGFLANNFQGQAYFESQDFYTADRMSKFSPMGGANPIIKINDFYESLGNQETFMAVELAKFMRWTAIDLRPVLIQIATLGLIYYNVETDEVTIRKKLFNYINANRKKSDYDIITFHSVKPGYSNADLNLLNNNFDLRIYGVKQVLLSDTQQVFVFPKNQEVLVKKGRDFLFSGVVAAGKFEFHGKEFIYKYDENKVGLKNVDSLRIYVTALEKDVNGRYPFKRVQTVIENINGELAVDAPANHAGYKKAPAFPIFRSFKESYTFYDKRGIQKGVYNRDNFYFKLDPFVIDSVDNFTNAALKFNGEFSSAGILPTFRDTLTLQKDYSLGFVRSTPPGGFQMYGGKAVFTNEIRLSNKGLRAGGDVKFGPSVSKSDDFLLFPDSMNGIASSFDITETETPEEFPQAHGEKVYLHWMPYKDLMQAYDREKPFTSYNSQAVFTGRYDLSPNELYGKGKVDFEKADLISQKILFKRKKFYSDTANFHLKAFDEEGFTFSTENVNSTIDFENRTGIFVSNGAGSYVRFDKNQYIAYMERFKWFMDNENIQLGDEQKKLDANVENALDLEGPEFISTHPKQDSLRFFAPAANYNLRKYIIHCKNVPFINVADARLFPDSGNVTIFKNAVIDTLENAVILANTVTKYHTIKNVRANIFGRKSYLATGDYTYLDENNSPFLIQFAKIQPDTAGETVSEGVISEQANFRFNPYFSFAGKVKLFASNQFLTFDGGTKIVHTCDRVSKSYLKFTGEINPKEIFIPIADDPKDVNNNDVGTGIFFKSDSSKVYSAFISPLAGKRDKVVLSASGFIYFDKEAKEYRISSKEKLEENSLPGNYMSLNTDNCLVYGEGKMDLGADFGQVKIVSAGSGTHYTVNDSSSFQMMMTVDFFFENRAMKKMFQDMEVYLTSFEGVDFSKPLYEKGLREILGGEKADKAISDLNLYGGFKRFPDELEKSMFLNEINLSFDKESKSFLSSGAIGVGNILKNEYNKYVPGVVQIKKQKAGDLLTIYFELDQSTWYYFSYFKGVMSVVSSNKEFNEIIKELKPKNRKMDVDKGPSYQFTLVSPLKKDQFLKKLNLFKTDDEEQEKE